MAVIHGRKGRLYAGIASGGTAEPITFLTNWKLGFETDKVDVTSLGDSNKTYVAGLPDASGEYSGWFDNATAQLYTAATDGVARKFYLYPDNSSTGQYWFGTGIFDFSIEGTVSDAVKINGGFAASTIWAKVG